VHWARSGPPDNPRAWLLRVARRKAIDRIRRKARFADRVKDIEMMAAADQEAAAQDAPEIPDQRLALIFTCCHPALDPKSRVALTLRSLGGLTTAEVARAFLDSEPTMGQRLSRAKAKIARAGIGFAVPGPELWAERLESVLAVVYLIYNQCYSTGGGPLPGREEDLCDEAIYLARMLACMLPDEPEVRGLLALLLLTGARRSARQGDDGVTVPLPLQDAARWDAAMLAEGLALADAAGPDDAAGPFVLQARIGAEHMRQGPGQTSWLRVLRLYDLLLSKVGTPVVALNRAVAVAELFGPHHGLAELDTLAPDLSDYQPYHAARADFLARDGQWDAARDAYDRAIAEAPSAGDARLLTACRDALPA
jgi:RNA polymerase sigma-70 factor (ECF subfamily)